MSSNPILKAQRKGTSHESRDRTWRLEQPANAMQPALMRCRMCSSQSMATPSMYLVYSLPTMNPFLFTYLNSEERRKSRMAIDIRGRVKTCSVEEEQ